MPETSQEALLSKQNINKPKILRDLLKKHATVALPGAFNAISAKLAEAEGFEALYISGAGIANGVGGYPDIGFMTAGEMATQAGYTARATSLPAIADGDNGYGEAINVFRTVQQYEREGLSGIHIEDQLIPKRCGHLNGKQVISTEAMIEKIAAAKEARSNPDFLLIARVDSKAVYGLADAIERANAYLSAGADMIFAEALESEEEFLLYRKEVSGLLMANMTEFGKTPLFNLQEFERFGYNMVIFPMTAFRMMMGAVAETYRTLKSEGSQRSILDRMTSREALYELIHYQAYESLDASLATQYSKKT
ncbi:MAG: methylisocitrate lyase [Vampirovibrionales bacterium]|nr:methylisocitrate lyase [Vampirovibrionales bacterium]